jgi:anti-sigma B factor antagonist
MNVNTTLTERAGFSSSQLLTHAVFTLRGDVDRSTTPALRERLLIALHHTKTPVIIDLSRVSSCDGSGLALLIGARRRARLHGIHTSLAAPQPRVSDLLRSTGLHRAFTIHPTLAAAQLNRRAVARAAVA